MRFGKPWAAVLALLALMGCSSMKISDFENQEPKLELEQFFAGKTEASGIFYDRFGDVRRQFVVDIEGTVEGDRLTLVEDFVYDDGETERRVWTLTRIGENRYEGHADGVIGLARGEIAGNAFHWEYTFDLKMKDRTLRVAFDDWMFLQPNGTVINRATVSKWGIELGTAVISFSKPAVSAQAGQEQVTQAAE
ncbi:MAG: DUF3833 domain-containing protein [Alphaproteobacteria bacterium]|uniref:DUF3833 domain-containing protein n=1 Tax=Pacificispira sp. TaxID=2888761 RepID=UPI001B2D8F05|nr:DUF3833 domain-containing protein [Alphaproteobacteria bacterium]MBO6862363.1 DUF3833 domain-containing protein [Alphaproteobacteria bacterium]MEC9268903.1 DUF3833 domain-containing protein [Pseudomonadota bacterium]